MKKNDNIMIFTTVLVLCGVVLSMVFASIYEEPLMALIFIIFLGLLGLFICLTMQVLDPIDIKLEKLLGIIVEDENKENSSVSINKSFKDEEFTNRVFNFYLKNKKLNIEYLKSIINKLIIVIIIFITIILLVPFFEKAIAVLS